jgi:hypothetical protein
LRCPAEVNVAKKVRYDIQKAVDYILDVNKPGDLRAIRLFVLVVVLHKGEAIARVTGHDASSTDNTLSIRISAATLRHARLLAGMKFIEQIERDWKKENSSKRATIKRMAGNREFASVYNKVILKHGGWYKIRYSPNLRQFQTELASHERFAKEISKLVDFSARFKPDPKKPKQIGGITMAIAIVTQGAGKSFYATEIKSTRMEDVWSHLRSSAPFLYLLHMQGWEFKIGNVVGKNFTKRWRKLSADIPYLQQFFAAYNVVVRRLAGRGYIYSQLNLPADLVEPEIKFFDFDGKDVAGIRTAIESYRS